MSIEEAKYEDVLKLRHEVMYPDQDLELAKVSNDQEGIHLGIYKEGVLISAVSIFLENRSLQFRKLATKKESQNKGYATSLLKYIMAYADQFALDEVWANARIEALPFYLQLGFKTTEKSFTKNGHEYVIIKYKPTKKDLEENEFL